MPTGIAELHVKDKIAVLVVRHLPGMNRSDWVFLDRVADMSYENLDVGQRVLVDAWLRNWLAVEEERIANDAHVAD